MNDQQLNNLELSSGRFELNAGTVDVWSLSIKAGSETVERLKRILSTDERERAERFRFEDRRSLFVAGRAMLRILLSFYLHESPETVGFHYGAKGKPCLAQRRDIYFNLAHSGDRALYAFASKEVGVDLELVKPVPDWKKISRRFFSPREVEDLESLNPEEQAPGFFACWTRKEAYLKATGDGLYLPLNQFYAGAIPSRAKGVIEEDGSPARWFFKDLRPGDGYIGALVTQSAETDVRLLHFDDIEESIRFLSRENELR